MHIDHRLTSYAEAPAGCLLVIYAEPNFGGQSALTSENQPDLSGVGWDKAISSIQVEAGHLEPLLRR